MGSLSYNAHGNLELPGLQAPRRPSGQEGTSLQQSSELNSGQEQHPLAGSVTAPCPFLPTFRPPGSLFAQALVGKSCPASDHSTFQ